MDEKIHITPATMSWILSIQQVRRTNPLVAALLQFCVFLYPNDIPVEILDLGIQTWMDDIEANTNDHYSLDETIEKLVAYSFIRPNARMNTFTMHEVVQATIKDTMDKEARREWSERVVRTCAKLFPINVVNVGEDAQYLLCERYLSQAHKCAKLIEQEHMVLPEAVDLLYRVGIYLLTRCRYIEAEPFLKKSFEMRKQLLDT